MISTTVLSKVEDAPHMEEVLGIFVLTSCEVGMVLLDVDGLQMAFLGLEIVVQML